VFFKNQYCPALRKKLIFLIVIGFTGVQLQAQDKISDTINTVNSSYLQKDIIDCFRQWFKLKPSTKAEGIQPGDKMVISVIPAVGYTLQTRFAGILSGNVAFFTSNKPNTKLSVVSASPTYTENKQFTIPVQLNIWLPGNQWNLIGDWRFMKYPQSTFGLGSNASLTNETPMDYRYVRVYQNILKKITPSFSAGVGYNLDYHWNITSEPSYSGEISDYEKYGTSPTSVSSGLTLNMMYDSRKNIINSLQGLAAGVTFRNNAKWLGSDAKWQSLLIDVRKYFRLPGAKKNVLAFWSYNWFILGGTPPYLDLPSTGWDGYNNTGRGFIQGRFRGDKMMYLESEYRFDITRNGLIGAVVFSNAQTFSPAPSSPLQSIQPGAGAGVRIKLNKKSDTNIAIDYGFGTQGSRGLFVNIGEVF
jgi:hypothetical protein